MDHHTVTTRDALIATITAAAETTFEMARQSPFTVRCGTTRYTFREGVTVRRAQQLARKIRKMPAKAFSVGARDGDPA